MTRKRFQHKQGEAYISDDGVAFVPIPKNASSSFRRLLLEDLNWRRSIIHHEKPRYVFTVLREPVDRYLSGWTQCQRRYGLCSGKIGEPFCRDDHTTLQTWFLRAINPDRFVLIEDLADGLEMVSIECGINLRCHWHENKSKDEKPTEYPDSLLQYLTPDISLYGKWFDIFCRQGTAR